MDFKHISSNPEILSGKPCITGTRISVEMILEFIASGASISDISKKYSHVSEDAVKEAILYASKFFQNEIIVTTKRVA